MQHKCCWQATMMNWWAIFSWDHSSAAGIVPRRGRPDIFRWGPGAGRQAGQGPGLALGLGQFSEVVPPGSQMDGYVSWSCVPAAQSAAPEESTSWALNHPESSGFCRCRSHQWNQNLLFQMERQTMHNMSWCTLCDRLVPATNEAAGADHKYSTVVRAVVLESKGL